MSVYRSLIPFRCSLLFSGCNLTLPPCQAPSPRHRTTPDNTAGTVFTRYTGIRGYWVELGFRINRKRGVGDRRFVANAQNQKSTPSLRFPINVAVWTFSVYFRLSNRLWMDGEFSLNNENQFLNWRFRVRNVLSWPIGEVTHSLSRYVTRVQR